MVSISFMTSYLINRTLLGSLLLQILFLFTRKAVYIDEIYMNNKKNDHFVIVDRLFVFYEPFDIQQGVPVKRSPRPSQWPSNSMLQMLWLVNTWKDIDTYDWLTQPCCSITVVCFKCLSLVNSVTWWIF